jgi:hypothetical protein
LTGLVKSDIPLLGGLQTIETIGAVMPDVAGLMAAMALQVVVLASGRV